MATEGINGAFNPNSVGTRSTENVSAKNTGGDGGRGSATTSRSGDHATITSTASQLHQIASAVDHTSDVDVKRVEAVRQEIASGNFEINANRIADKMISLDTSLSRSGAR